MGEAWNPSLTAIHFRTKSLLLKGYQAFNQHAVGIIEI